MLLTLKLKRVRKNYARILYNLLHLLHLTINFTKISKNLVLYATY